MARYIARIRTNNSWGFVLQSATQSEARFNPQHASFNSLVDTRIICIFLFMEPNKSGPTTIGVPVQGISAISCDNKKYCGKRSKMVLLQLISVY